jgi:hypothetical protein
LCDILSEKQKINMVSKTRLTAEDLWLMPGCTKVRLDSVDEDMLEEAMTLAWQNSAAEKRAAGRTKARRTTRAIRPSRKR